MIDIISSLQNVCSRWDPSTPTMNAEPKPTSGLFAREKSTAAPYLRVSQVSEHGTADRRRKLSAGNVATGNKWSGYRKEERRHSLGQFKIMPTHFPYANSFRSTPRDCCFQCSPSIRKILYEELKPLGLRNLLLVTTKNSEYGYLTRCFQYLVHVLKLNAKFFYPDSSVNILQSSRVKNAIENATLNEIEEGGIESKYYARLMKRHQKRAARILYLMKAKISVILIKLTGWLLFKTLGRMLSSIQISKCQIEMLKQLHQSSAPIIYLPLHRSHLDYILVTFILFNYEVKAPLVAAGDNLSIPVFGPLLRGLGAFFIKRKIDKDQGRKDFVYRAVLHTYMEQILVDGHSVEFFIEGGRSRSGKACIPKAGLLSIVVDAFLDGSIEDAYLVPIGISYEKLLDGKFISEQMGKPKVPESLTSALRGIWNALCGDYGSVRVDFSKPFSLREFIQASKSFVYTKPRSLLNKSESPTGVFRRQLSTTSLYGMDVVIEDQRALIKGLAEHILYDAVCSTALMSTNVLAFLLLNKYRKGVLLRSLMMDFDWLWNEALFRGRYVGLVGTTKTIINHAIELLGEKLVLVQRPAAASEERVAKADLDLAFIKPKITLPEVLELSYYSNVMLSVFLGDAIIASVLFVLVGEHLSAVEDCQSELTVSRQQLVEKALDLCNILQYEFILTPPCVKLESSINEMIDNFVTFEYLIDEQKSVPRDRQKEWSDRVAKSLEWEQSSEEEDSYVPDSHLKVNLLKDNITKFQLYRNILAPYLEGYWHLACSLRRLLYTEMEQNQFIQLVQQAIIEKTQQGLIEHVECVAADTLQNGIKLFESWKVVQSHVQDNIKIIYLSEDYQNDEELAHVRRTLEEFKM